MKLIKENCLLEKGKSLVSSSVNGVIAWPEKGLLVSSFLERQVFVTLPLFSNWAALSVLTKHICSEPGCSLHNNSSHNWWES